MTTAPQQPPVPAVLPCRPRHHLHRAAVLLAAALAAVAPPAHAAPEVGVSVHVSQPGAYGRVDIGRVPPPAPALVYLQPILVQPPPRAVAPQPVYMWVPPGHQKKWAKHCARYDACGVPVYFVQDRWYREHVRERRGAPQHAWGGPAGGHPHAPAPVYAPAPAAYAPPGPPGHARGHGRGHDAGEHPGHGRGHAHGHGHRGD